MKNLYLCFLALIVSSGIFAQKSNPLILSSPGEIDHSIFEYNESFADEVAIDKARNFRENSLGIFYMPIPLNFEKFTITEDGNTSEFSPQGTNDDAFDFEFQGYGISANMDFNKSGKGLGILSYYALIDGGALTAEDVFAALKYDFIFDIDLPIELSPLLGVGSLNFQFDDQVIGSSLYASAGARFTWLISNTFILGADVQTVPYIFNPEKFLGVEDTADEATVDYKFIAQANISLRINLSKN